MEVMPGRGLETPRPMPALLDVHMLAQCDGKERTQVMRRTVEID